MNRSKRIGTAAETAVVEYLRDQGFMYVERRAQHGANDMGDISGIPGVVIEVKNCKTLEFSKWLEEAEQERVNAGAQLAVVVAKRRGKANPKDWYWLATGPSMVQMLKDALDAKKPQP